MQFLHSKKEYIIFFGIIVLFLFLRIPGLHNLYHQDEYKWPSIVLNSQGGIPHPPVGEFIYRNLGEIVGADNFRIIPLIFSFINLFLLFYLIRLMFNPFDKLRASKAALWGAGLFAVSFYSVLASLMVDTDGAVMPMFFLIMCIGYFKLRVTSYEIRGKNWKWLTLLILAAIGGFFVKASFIIAIGAVVLDFAFEKGVFSDRKKILKYVLFCFGGAIFLGLLLFVAKLIFPFFNLQSSILYWKHFFKLGDRGWLQTFIQFAKAILYTSPLLILPPFLIDKEVFKKTRAFFIFIGLGLIFYLLLFDFSTGALDRYFQFMIVPLCVIGGAVFAKYLNYELTCLPARRGIKNYAFLFVISISIFSLQFFNHFAPPLHPKTEWIDRVLSLKWGFLFPFTGGSGPTGFYISFAFMALIWIVSLVFIRKKLLFGVLILGLLYNGVFIEEYLFGKINGSPYGLFREAKEFIANNEEIKKVVVYNDIGGYDIQKFGKYERRLYATPQFEGNYKEFFRDFSGHVLYIDIPKIGENNFYSNYLASCKSVYQQEDSYITAKILECHD